MWSKSDEIILDALRKKDLLPEEELLGLAKGAKTSEMAFIFLVTKRCGISESQVMQFVAEDLNLGYLNLKDTKIDKAVIDAVPYKFAWHYKFLPVEIQNNILTVAVSVPLDIKTQDELRLHFGFSVKMVIASENEIIEQLKRIYGLGAEMSGKNEAAALEKIIEHLPQEEIQDIGKLAEDTSIIKLVNQIILEAYKKRATDIHIEPYRGEFKLRYRIDGVLYDANVSSNVKRLLLPILSRIKIMSNLNIVEHRLPQDGRAVVKSQDQVIDLRVSFIPTPYGESLVIRILPAGRTFSLEKIGLSLSDQKIFENLISKPHGIIFVTGPTGSGKTTTLYACLTRINKRERKIITIEDPIEYEMPGVIQIQTMPEIGLDFARGLRSMLRHDPDIMMIGEVRDLETAEIAMRAALTGHLVFSTLHTNDAAGGIMRLLDIGVEPYLISSSVEAFIAQRLVRLICPHCKVEDITQPLEVKRQIVKELGNDLDPGAVKLYKGQGCDQCNFTGFLGRSAIFEVLIMNTEMKEAVIRKLTTKALNAMAEAAGMRSLRQDGWLRVLEGMTTPEEIMKVTQEEKSEEPKDDLASFDAPSIESDLGYESFEADKPPKEKRIFERLVVNVPVHWKKYSLDKKAEKSPVTEFATVIHNISAGGLVFLTKEFISIGSILELRIDLPQELPLNCLARVVRLEEMEVDSKYSIAVCFLGVSGAERARLNKFISEKRMKV